MLVSVSEIVLVGLFILRSRILLGCRTPVKPVGLCSIVVRKIGIGKLRIVPADVSRFSARIEHAVQEY